MSLEEPSLTIGTHNITITTIFVIIIEQQLPRQQQQQSQNNSGQKLPKWLKLGQK